MVLGLYTKGRSSMKFKLPKMPKVKMPDIVGNAKKLGKAVSKEVGLNWEREHWFTRFHEALKLGGILVELVKPLDDVPSA